MDRRRILIVSNGFYPEISPRSYRATELAKEFCRQGHEVTVISKFRSHDYKKFLSEFPILFKMWGKSKLPRIPNFNNGFLSYFNRVLSRFLLILFEYPEIEHMFYVRKVLKNKIDYDLLISFAVPYPVHWGVAWARSGRHKIAKIWVADCGDPYMGDVLDSFKKLFYFKFLEKWFCKRADFITIPILGAISGYYPEFHYKIRIIPQGFDFDLEAVRNNQAPFNDIPTFAYAGNFIPGVRDPRKLLKYLSELNIQFRFYVYTNNSSLLDEYKDRLKEKLVISDYIPRLDLMKKLSQMDFLVNFDNNTVLNSPSKLIDYSIVNRPVLNLTNEFKGEDVSAFLERNYSGKMELPDPRRYHIRNVSKQFLDLLN